MKLRKWFGTGLAVILTVVMLTGCSSTGSSLKSENYSTDSYDSGYYDDSYYNDSFYNEQSITAAEETAPQSAYDNGLTDVTDSTEYESNAKTDRKIITTVNMSVETENYDRLLDSINSKVSQLGGYLETYNKGYYYDYSYDSDENLRYAYITARIPSDQMDSFVSLVEGESNVISQNSSSTDVTLDYVDIESKKIALETEYESLLALLAQADSVENIIALQSRLSEVRYEIQSIESQLRTYDNKVDYSTIYLDISEVIRITPVIKKEVSTWDKIKTGFDENMYSLKKGFTNAFIGIAVSLPYIIMCAIIIIIALLIVWICVKVNKKKYKKNRTMVNTCQTEKQDSQR